MLGTKYRGRRKGVSVREGSVGEARREARLTLAQVAGDKLSRTAIHLIEKGRTRPSVETLQLIARQTRKPIEFFLTPDSPSALTERQMRLRELERREPERDQKVVRADQQPVQDLLEDLDQDHEARADTPSFPRRGCPEGVVSS